MEREANPTHGGERERPKRWFPVLEELIDSGAWAGLSLAECKVLVACLRHRDGDGVCRAGVESLARAAGVGRAAVYKAIKALTDHPAGLMARQGTGCEPLPGRVWAGTVRRQSPGVDSLSTGVDGKSPGGDCGTGNARTRQTRPEDAREIWSGGRAWNDLGGYQRAVSGQSVRQALSDLDVRMPLLGEAAMLAGLSVGEVLEAASGVWGDRQAGRIGNAPVCLVRRLCAARGITTAAPDAGMAELLEAVRRRRDGVPRDTGGG